LADLKEVYTRYIAVLLHHLRWLGGEKSFLGIVIRLLNLGELNGSSTSPVALQQSAKCMVVGAKV